MYNLGWNRFFYSHSKHLRCHQRPAMYRSLFHSSTDQIDRHQTSNIGMNIQTFIFQKKSRFTNIFPHNFVAYSFPPACPSPATLPVMRYSALRACHNVSHSHLPCKYPWRRPCEHHDYDVIIIIIIKICVQWKWIQFMQQKIPERTIFHIGSVNPTHHTPLRTHSTICNNAQEAWTENKNMFSIYSNRIRCVVLYTLTKYYVTQKLNFFSALLKSTRRVKCALKSKHWHVKRTF